MRRMSTDDRVQVDGKLLCYRRGYTPARIRELIERHSLTGLRVFAELSDERLHDIEFLRECSFLKELIYTNRDDFDLSPLSALTQLESLHIGFTGKQKHEIDLRPFPRLRSLSLYWRPGKVRGLETLVDLESLGLQSYNEKTPPEDKDLSRFATLRRLKKIRITSGGVTSLRGLEQLPALEELQLGNCRQLTSIGALQAHPSLRELGLDICPKVGDYDRLTDLPRLESLELMDCGKIPSLTFIDRLPALVHLFTQGSTDIVDGDVRPALRLRDAVVSHRQHYNMRVPNPEAEARWRRNLETFHRIEGELGR
jgi:hypothetical protein